MDRTAQSSAPAKKLTPIRMRGKRKTSYAPTAGAAARSSSSRGTSTDVETAAAASKLSLGARSSLSLKKRAREPSPDSASASTGGGSTSKAKKVSSTRRMRMQRYTPFDRWFPLEILERVFFFSRNFNLPLASPRLGLKLSNRHTLRDLVMEAFAPYWDLSQVRGYREPRLKSAEGIAKRRAMKAKLKNQILECSWARMDLLVEAQQIWLQKNKLRGKTYGHTFCPQTEEPEMGVAAKFVLNIKDLETLAKSHSPDHIISVDLLDWDGWRGDSNNNNYNNNNNSDEHDAFDDDESTDFGDDETQLDIKNEGDRYGEDRDDGVYLAPDASRSEYNGDEIYQRLKVPMRPAKVEPLGGPHNVSAHVCFALDEYFVLESLYRHSRYDPKMEEEPHRLLEAHVAEPREADKDKDADDARDMPEPASAVQLLFFRMSVSIYRRGGASRGVRIPEWLQLAGGPYPPSKSQTREGRKALRNRLRDAFDMLTWLVHSGTQLQATDSWETTWEGYQQLLQVDVRPHAWDAYEDGEDIVTMHHSYKSQGNGQDTHQQTAPGRPVRLQYGVDTLVAGMLSHFYALGVFYKQWPPRIVREAMQRATDFGKRENGAFKRTQTYKILQRIALLCHPDGETGDEWLAQTWQEMRF